MNLGNMNKFASAASIAAFLLLAANTHAAKIYTCVINGDTVYTSKPQGNCHSADLPSLGRYSSGGYQEQAVPKTQAAPVYQAPKGTAKKAAPRQPAAPVVTQTPPPVKATGGRRQILEQELANERKALADAQKALAAGRSVSGQNNAQHQSSVRQLESAVLDRQQNIQALQRELGRM